MDRSSDSWPREPAQYGREVLNAHVARALGALAFLVVATAAVGATAGWTSVWFVEALLLAIVIMWAMDVLVTPRLARRRQGNDGELTVAAALAEVEALGWRALHDISTGRGNIDHVVVGPGGIFTVETKSHRGRVHARHVDPRWRKQAYAQKKWLESITGLGVEPLLVFSDAYVIGNWRWEPRCPGSEREDAGCVPRRPVGSTECR